MPENAGTNPSYTTCQGTTCEWPSVAALYPLILLTCSLCHWQSRFDQEKRMRHRSFDLRIETGTLSDGHSWFLAATLHLPDDAHSGNRVPLVVCLPGGGYNRHYFNLREPGYREARHHTDRGAIVIAIDHLRVGESDIPELEDASLEIAAEANHAVLKTMLERLGAGTLCDGVAPLQPSAVIGEAQSMGGHIALLMQANHRSFDGLAMLGSSAVCTRLPAKTAGEEICLLGKDNPSEGLAALRTFDKRFAFHWEDVPEVYAGADGGASALLRPMPVAALSRDICQARRRP